MPFSGYLLRHMETAQSLDETLEHLHVAGATLYRIGGTWYVSATTRDGVRVSTRSKSAEGIGAALIEALRKAPVAA